MDDVLYEYDWCVRMPGMTGVAGLATTELRERWWAAGGESAAEAGDFHDGDDYLTAMEHAFGTFAAAH